MNNNDMKEIILKSPEQITHSIEVNQNARIEGDIDSIILAGMGGSGHPGDLLNALHLTTVPLLVHRSYDLPRVYGKNPLVICSSYSGNTEEALSSYEIAGQAGYARMINTAGGKLEELSKEDGVPLSRIDYAGMQPRHTLFASFVGLATALSNSGLAQDISEDLKRVAKVLEEKIPKLEEPAKALAAEIKGSTPIYTSSDVIGFAAKNFKIQTNENSKTTAFWNEFPELNHNEMVGMTKPQGKYHVVMLRDDNDHPRVKARMDVTAEIYEKRGIKVSNFNVEGDTLLEKLFYTVSFGLWTTYYLAKEYDIDPVPVEGVENFKTRLAEVAGEI